jgi:eukaryotic-like serine/threonine-protein kinase
MAAERRLADRYVLDELVAQGGMGAVWRGRDLRLDRPVAVKVMAGDALIDPSAVERFDREARIVARLTHPNIVAVYDFGSDGADSYLVMELVEGRSVADLIAVGPLSVAQALTIAAQTCDGLAAAHAAGVVHRDVKPANLIVTPAGVVKVCDFGIALLQHAVGQSRLTGSAVALGSTRYMAPEQVLDQPVDERVDLYGLGCTIYAMLTGSPPFPGDNPIAVVEQHVTQAPPDVRSRRPEVPADLAALVNRLLAKAPADRPADARAVAARLAAMFGEIAPAELATSDLRLAAIPGAAAIADLRVPAPTGVPPARSRWRTWALLAAGLMIVTALILVPLLGNTGPTTADVPPASAKPSSAPSPAASPAAPTPSRTVRPQPAATTKPPVIAAPNPTVSPPRSPARTTPAPPTDPIVGMRLTIQQQVTAGHLAPASANDLYKKVDEIAAKINEGNGAESAKKIKELRDKLTGLRRDGRLSQAGYEALTASLDRIAATAPTPTPRPKP